MKNSIHIFLILLLMTNYKSWAEKRTKSYDLDIREIINSELVKFRKEAAVFNVAIGQIVYTTKDHSHVQNGDLNIYISLSEITPYLKNQSIDIKRQFIKYLLGHEIAHKIHYNMYQAQVIKNGHGEGILFMECFADLFSGFIMTQVFTTIDLYNLTEVNPKMDIAAYCSAQLPTILKVYEMVFKMDEKNTDRNTHPTHEQRIVALRQGMTLGYYVFNEYMFAHATPESLGITREVFDNQRNIWDGIGKGLGYNFNNLSNNNYFYWAHLEAIRIINENNTLARNLIRFSTKVAYNFEGRQPTVNYTFKLYNENPFPVRFNGRVITELVAKDDPENIVYNTLIDGSQIDVTIRPNDYTTISGILKTRYTDIFESRLIIPGDRHSFYYVFEANKPFPDPIFYESFDYNFSRWNNNTISDIKNLLCSIESKRPNLLSYSKGIGVSKEDTYEGFILNKRIFAPIFQAGHESDQQIYYKEKDGVVVYTFNACTTRDSDAAVDHYREINDTIASFFHRYQAQPEKKLIYSTKKEFWDLNGSLAIKVISHIKDDNGFYIIKVEVYGTPLIN